MATRIELGVAALTLALLAAACGSSDPVALIAEGHTALGFNDTKSAQSKFEAALRELQPGSAEFIEAKLGLVQAKIPSDTSVATEEFIELVSAFPQQLGEKEFVFIAGQMISSKKYADAFDVLYLGIQRAGGESHAPLLMAQMERWQQAVTNDPVSHTVLGAMWGYADCMRLEHLKRLAPPLR